MFLPALSTDEFGFKKFGSVICIPITSFLGCTILFFPLKKTHIELLLVLNDKKEEDLLPTFRLTYSR